MGAGALGVDAEQLTLVEDPARGGERALGGVGARAVDRAPGRHPEKNFFWNQPLTPGVVKYSALATKVTRRVSVSGMNSQSAYERWLLARIAGPVLGDVLGSLDVGTEDHPEDGTEGDPLQEPVEHPDLQPSPDDTVAGSLDPRRPVPHPRRPSGPSRPTARRRGAQFAA